MELEPIYHPDYVLENLDFFGDSNDNYPSGNNIIINNNNSSNISDNNHTTNAGSFLDLTYPQRTQNFLGEMPKNKKSCFRSVSMRLPNIPAECGEGAQVQRSISQPYQAGTSALFAAA
ncbi:hypothetical protein EGW08_003991, partial [Elysia chlorotica]